MVTQVVELSSSANNEARAKRWRGIFAVTALIAAFAFGPFVAGANADEQHHWISVSWLRQMGNPVSSQPWCSPEGRCLISVNDQASLTGDFTGTLTSTGASTIYNNVFTSSAVAILSLTDSPCGAGTLVLENTLAGSTGDSDNTWRISAGQGTGDLVDVKGRGIIELNPGSPALFSGRISCD